MSELLSKEINCNNCLGAPCCMGGRVLRLSDEEFKLLGGTEYLETFRGTEDGRDTRLDRRLKKRCKHSVRDETGKWHCRVHGENQPLVCGDGFLMGGITCRRFREEFLNPQPEKE